MSDQTSSGPSEHAADSGVVSRDLFGDSCVPGRGVTADDIAAENERCRSASRPLECMRALIEEQPTRAAQIWMIAANSPNTAVSQRAESADPRKSSQTGCA